MKPSRPALASIFSMPAPQLPIQIYVITIDGQDILCVGPAIHPPKHPDNTYVIQNVEFGERITTAEALRLLDGSLLADVERQ